MIIKGYGFIFIVVLCFDFYIVLCLVCFFVCCLVVPFWVWHGRGDDVLTVVIFIKWMR